MLRIAMITAGALLAVTLDAQGAAAIPAYVSAAVADKTRPDADVQRDADRKPADMLVFAGIKPGAKVADLLPGGGGEGDRRRPALRQRHGGVTAAQADAAVLAAGAAGCGVDLTELPRSAQHPGHQRRGFRQSGVQRAKARRP